MVILSLFDGISCGRIALDRAGIKVDKYYASEIDPYAEKISASNYPDIIRLGDITKWREWNIEKPDIILAGSPCQGFSFAGKGLNFNDPRSAMFFTFVDILKHYKPKYFLLENVKMKAEHNDVISGLLGELYPECVDQGELFRTGRLEPVLINSALVSAQNRERLYWCNWKVSQPEDKGILLQDILENGVTEKDKSYCIDANYYKGTNLEQYKTKGRRQIVFTEKRTEKAKEIRREYQKTGRDFSPRRAKELVPRIDNKCNCLTTALTKEHILLDETSNFRKLTVTECERLQTVPDGYCKAVSNSRAYHALGNGWTVDVIAHILKERKC